jgi:ABC-2 type transport system ATP-binding protein
MRKGEGGMLEIRELSKLYHGTVALDKVSFCAKPGEVTGYLGPNGSGKSTTVKILTGLIQPSGGSIYYNGEEVRRDMLAFKRRIGYVPEEPHLYTYLTGAEYLELAGQLRGLEEKRLEKKIEGFLRLFGLWGDRFTPLSAYSKGMRQKILLAAALLHDPEIVVLDEPFSGLDVNSAMVLRRLIQELAAAGKVVLYSSHALEVVERVCERVVILHRGRVVADDSVTHLRELMKLPSLEEIFTQLALEQDIGGLADGLMQVIQL